jgi:threonine dehydrogenase-like Zn-dependent dehydrogenase
MKSVMLVGKRTVEIRDIPMPRINAGEALIAVECVGVCGAEISWWTSAEDSSGIPCVLGHEFSGVIMDIHGDGEGFNIGDRVTADPLIACRRCTYCLRGETNLCDNLRLMGLYGYPGVFCEYVTLPLTRLYAIASEVSARNSVLAEPLASSIRLLRHIPPNLPKRAKIVIFGAGIQGIFCLNLARMKGWSNVAMVDVNDHRLHIANEQGASLIVNALEEDATDRLKRWTNGSGVEVGIDTSRSGDVRGRLLQVVAKGGTILLLGMNDPIAEADFRLVVERELKIQGSFGYCSQDFAKAVQYICDGCIALDRYIRVLPFADSIKAFALSSQFEGEYLKTVVCLKNRGVS